MKRAVCIWLPNWPLQRLRVARPALKHQAVVLHEPQHGRGLRVAYCSGEASRLGIRPGMPLAETAALRGQGSSDASSPPPDLHIEAADPAADRAGLVELAAWCEQFSPIVGLEEAEPPESLLLDVTGLGPLFGGEEAMTRRMSRAFGERNLAIRVAVADTIGAAWAVAHYGKHCGKACDREAILVASLEHRAALEPLPVEALRLADQSVELLGRLGLERVGQLLSLPRASLLSRFDEQLLRRLDQATGAAKESIAAIHPPPDFTAQWSLEHPTNRHEQIDFVVGQLVERLAAMLAERGQGALQLVCRFDCRPSRTITREVGLFQPSAEAKHLLELVRLRLERAVLPGAVSEVHVEVTHSAPLACRQRRLFAGDEPEQESHGLALLLNRLAGRLGKQAVVQPKLHAEAQAELAYRYEPVVGAKPAKRARRAKPAGRKATAKRPAHGQEAGAGATARPAGGPLDRPIFLHPRPLPLRVMAVAPDGPPIRFSFGGREYCVARHWGPERIETGWWRKAGVRRDYYRVEATTGERFWLFRSLKDGQWFWHGEFA